MLDKAPTVDAQPWRILLLEDSDIDAELVQTHLEASDFRFEMLRATSRESFEAQLLTQPDLVLADYSLPSFDGMTALGFVREHHPDIPFIFVSGVAGEDVATNALQRGAVDYVTKRNLRRVRSAVARAIAEARERQRRLQIEADLRASEAASRIALRAARVGGWDFEVPAGRLVWDAKCRAVFGIGHAVEITYPVFLHAVHPDDKDRVDASVQRAITQWAHSEFSEQFRILTPQGELRWVESMGSSIFENGRCIRFVGIIRDISSEKSAELALLDRTASLQASVEQQAMERHLLWRNSQDLLAVIGPDGRLRDVTPSWERLLGQPVHEALQARLLDLVHPDDLERTGALLGGARPQGSIQFENRLRTASGDYRWFSWTATPDDNGVIYANGRDTTEEKLAAERVHAVEDALRQSQKMEAIGQLTGGIAHDFNNLLAGIIGSIDVIKRRIAKGRMEDLDRFMDAATTSAQRAAALTQRLLAFSRRQSLDVRAEDVNKVIGSMEELLRRSLGENVSLRIDTAANIWAGHTDANQLENAVLNLAINARDAMPDGGTLTISTQNVSADALVPPVTGLEPGDYVQVAVSDTGQGMSPEVLAKAFDPFFTTKPIGQGTGLGLSMVYGFVKQSGGHVNISSVPGKGTRIELFLRRAQEAAVPDAPETVAPKPAQAGQTVLVIEDDPAVRMLVLEALRDLGYQSLEAQDAGTALPFIEADGRIDLIVSDVGLPGLNGRQLAELARQHRPDVPILFVTGYAQGAEHREGYLGPGMAMLAKPFRNDELANRIHAMLQG